MSQEQRGQRRLSTDEDTERHPCQQPKRRHVLDHPRRPTRAPRASSRTGKHQLQIGVERTEKKAYQKKFSQRLLPERWDENGPNITITGGTEDLIHFSQPRTLTVREWARLQGFPDWYQFAGPRTTGGRRRAGDPDKGDWSRDLPKYTQIGNAVPVKLANEIGNHLKNLIK